jgi:type III secretion system needle length determinant
MADIRGFDSSRPSQVPSDKGESVSSVSPGQFGKVDDETKKAQKQFKEAYEEKEKPSGEKGASDLGLDEEKASPMSLSDLFSMQRSGGEAGAGKLEVTGTPLMDEVSESSQVLVEKLVNRILVAEDGLQGQSEIRLFLDENVLKDTEIRITRSLDGLLTVSLLTSDPNSFQTLAASRSDLQKGLESRENSAIQVNLDSASAGDGQADRRSQGYFEYEQEEK